MNGCLDLATISLILCELGLGLCVWISNPHRSLNQCFALLSLSTALWISTLECGFHCRNAEHVSYLIRICTLWGSYLPIGYNLIRLAITNPTLSVWSLVQKSRLWTWLFLVSAVFVFTPHYLITVQIPEPSASAFAIPDPVYGPLFGLWPVYYLASIVTVMVLYVRDLQQARGRARMHLQFVFWGLLLSTLVIVLFQFILPGMRGDSKSVRFSPFGIILLQMVIAYGIATRQMLDVGLLIRRSIGYAMLYTVLCWVYVAAWVITTAAMRWFGGAPAFAPNLVATLAVAFTLTPSHKMMRRFISKIIGNWQGINPHLLLPQTDDLLRSISTTEELIQKFGTFAFAASDADSLAIYLFKDDSYDCVWSSAPETPTSLAANNPIVAQLKSQRRHIYADSLDTRKENERQAYREIIARGACLALPISAANFLRGVILLSEKRSGRMYGDEQQATLQMMANRLGTAIENASLYTQLQTSKQRVETLVDQLLSGVIVTSPTGSITLLNREGLRILGYDKPPLGQSIDILPRCLGAAIAATCRSQQPLRDQTAILFENTAHPLPIRYGCRTFNIAENGQRGAFLIFDDLTQMKKLEEQLRRSDRLRSMGTLSASVAHEIKNPLVAIKTFVQLLPEKKHDQPFLNNFSQIIDGEVTRIDAIVNQLLSFSRPAQPQLSAIHLHPMLDNTLRLLHHNFTRRGIRVEKEWGATNDLLWADRQKIEQVLLNVLLNSEDAMPRGGTLALTTRIESHSQLVLRINDNGTGIPIEILEKIFDPFFTTKDNGTGLGLPITHSIVTEHHGTLEIKNRPQGGTTVTIRLPLCTEETSELRSVEKAI